MRRPGQRLLGLSMVVSLVAGFACDCRRTPARFEGYWVEPSDGGRPVGVAVFRTDRGLGWEPHGLLFERAGFYGTRGCADFLDSADGLVEARTVSSATGVVIQESDSSAVLTSDLRDWQYAISVMYRWARPDAGLASGLLAPSFHGELSASSLDEALLSLRIAYGFPDAGPFDVESSALRLTRSRRCP